MELMHDATARGALRKGIFCVIPVKTRDMQTWLAARYFLLDRWDDFQQQFTRARASFDPEAIHDLRVSSRRLRECLSIFAVCFSKRQLSPVSKELKRLTALLGSIRNTDEAILFFSSLTDRCDLDSNAAVMKIVATLQAKRAGEKRNLKRELKRIDPGALLGRIAVLCRNPHIFTPAEKIPFQPVVTSILGAVAAREKTILEFLPEALIEEHATAQHCLRVAVKKFRYRMELLAPFANNDYKTAYNTIKEYQETLGHMHDLDVFKKMITDFTSKPKTDSPLDTIIVERRKIFFTEFLRMHGASPLDKTGDLVRGLL